MSSVARVRRVVMAQSGGAPSSAFNQVTPSGCTYITDALSHPPPTSGPYEYSPPGSFLPGQPGFPGLAETFVDPVFGTTIRRLTIDYPNPGAGDIYVKNGWFNADATYFVNSFADGTVKAVNTTTGATKALTNPGGATRPDASCDPVDPDVFYYFSGTKIKKQLISTGTISDLKDFGSTLGSLGGSVDWIDNSGRYMLVNLGAPSFRLWDKQTDTLYTGAITDAIGGGFIGLTPDATYIVRVNATTKARYVINHGGQSIATTSTTFYTGGGDHSDVVWASDGKPYYLRGNNDFDPMVLEVVDIATGTVTSVGVWGGASYPHGPGNISGVSRGLFRDWCFLASWDGQFTDSVSTWYGSSMAWAPYRGEIAMINIFTGEYRRLAHNRSRQTIVYNHQPRVCVSWDGTKVAWASNFGYSNGVPNYADLYVMDVPQC